MQGPSSDPLDQRLDRWLDRGRALVDGVSGARPGSRAAMPSRQGRTTEGGAGWRSELQGLGRWVENRLDWLLEDEDDWREPWQTPAEDRMAPPPPPAGRSPLGADGAPTQAVRSRQGGPLAPEAAPRAGRRGLEAISRRGRGSAGRQAGPSSPGALSGDGRRGETPARADADRPSAGAGAGGSGARAFAAGAGGRAAAAGVPATPLAPAAGGEPEAWPDDELFSVTRWRRPDGPPAGEPGSSQSAGPPGPTSGGRGTEGSGAARPGRQQAPRPLPRSSRRRSP